MPDAFSASEIGERYDENALPWDTIEPASYEKWGSFPFNIDNLLSVSQGRVKSDKKFIEIQKESEESKERLKNTQLPIDLASVKLEQERNKALRKNSGMAGHGFDKEDDDVAPDHVLTPLEEEKRLVTKLQDDPYVRESLSLMGGNISVSEKTVAGAATDVVR